MMHYVTSYFRDQLITWLAVFEGRETPVFSMFEVLTDSTNHPHAQPHIDELMTLAEAEGVAACLRQLGHEDVEIHHVPTPLTYEALCSITLTNDCAYRDGQITNADDITFVGYFNERMERWISDAQRIGDE